MIAPVFSTPAFPHDHSEPMSRRTIRFAELLDREFGGFTRLPL